MEYKILKHELKIANLNLTLKNDPRKLEFDLKNENTNLTESMVKKTSKFKTLKEDHEELHKCKTIVKGELTQCKKQLEKLYTNREKIDESMPIQRPTYGKTILGYLFNMFAKKLEIRSELKEKRQL